MKKTLKLVGIFIAVLVAGIVGGLSVYFLIQENKTYYIYDLRIVEPMANSKEYIYLNEKGNYKHLKNQKVYLTASGSNKLEIGIYASTSTNTKDIEIVSSDPSVAEIIFENNKCYVYYKKEGNATITAKIDMVTDSFDIAVYNQFADDLKVYDNTYYGKYSSVYENKVIAYADDFVYGYDIVANSAFLEGDNDFINADLLRIDEASVNKDVFSSVKIDPVSKQLLIQCKSSISEELVESRETQADESIVIQSYYISSEGIMKLSKSYIVNVHIIAYTPEFLQIEMSATPDFADSYIFMDTINFENKDEDEIKTKIEEFLSYQKAEQYLSENSEKSTYTAYFTDKVSEIYLKFRKVYTNGDIVYLNPKNASLENNSHVYSFVQGENYLTLSQNKDYYILNLQEADFGGSTITITLKLDDYFNFERDFVFEFKDYTADNVLDFYKFDAITQTFICKYWDLRARYDNEICNKLGQIVDFGGIDIDFSTYPKPPQTDPEEDSEQNSDTEVI